MALDLLSDEAFDDLVLRSVQSIRDRALLIAHNTKLGHRFRRLSQQVDWLTSRNAQKGTLPPEEPLPPAPTPPDASAAVQQAREAIVAWIEKTNPGDTVRASYARKVAAQIRAGEDLR